MSNMGSNQTPFTAVVMERGDKFFLYEPGVAVIASAESVEAAYAKFADARRAYMEEIRTAGLTPQAPVQESTTSPSERSIGRELGMFAAKFAIVLLVIAVIGGPVALALERSIAGAGSAVANALGGMGSISLKDVSRKTADIARDAQDLPEDQKETLRQSVGIISRELAPIFDAWRNPPEPKAAPADSPAIMRSK